ncbi:MAG: hypothetical protein NTY02_01400 [Acidobacteria bacterium]|nr:hypothetical protein [Acidobacteriota bacterium]
MRVVRAFIVAVAVAVLAESCGGSGGGSSSPPPSTPTTPTSPANPCAGIGVSASAAEAPIATSESSKRRGPAFDRDPRWGVLEALWTHAAGQGRARDVPRAFTDQATAPDVGEVAVVLDEGDVILPANAFDLKGKGLTFVRNAAGGFDVRSGDATFQADLGTRLSLGDDDAANVPLAFTASYFGQSYASAFVNSDGNVTFGEADTASTERDVARFLAGAPRVAPAFADLDPSSGGAVFANAKADTFTVTWCNVPGFDDPQQLTAQMTLARDGTITVRIADTTTRTDVILGVSPGRTSVFEPADLSQASSATIAGGAGAVGERFAAAEDVDLVTLARKFYQTHPDTYDQLLVWSDRRLITDAFAYEITVANEIRGIGVDLYDSSRTFGSAGRLRSVVMMDSATKYRRARRRRRCLAGTTPIGASSWTPTRPSWKGMTSRISEAGSSARSVP